MRPEEQRTALAEACGWQHLPAGVYGPEDCWFRSEPEGECVRNTANLPDYLNDLNAMHEASLRLDRAQRNRFINLLSDMTCTEEIDSDPIEADFAWINATAAQRAEALLKTLNLWTE